MAPTDAVATVQMLHTVTNSVPVGHVSGMTALGGNANLTVKGTAQAQVHHRLKAARPVMIPPTVRAAAAVGPVAAVGAVAAAVAVVVEVHQHLLEMVGVLPLVGTLARLVQVLSVLEPVQQRGAKCCLLRATSFDAKS